MQEFESCEIYIAILLLGFAANDLKKNTIRDGGSTAQIIGFLGLIIELLKCV